MFDPRADAETPTFNVDARRWADRVLLLIPVELIAYNERVDAQEIAESVVRGANAVARYPSTIRRVFIQSWLRNIQIEKDGLNRLAKLVAPQLLEYYDQKTLFDFLRDEHGFSMHDLMELFLPE